MNDIVAGKIGRERNASQMKDARKKSKREEDFSQSQRVPSADEDDN